MVSGNVHWRHLTGSQKAGIALDEKHFAAEAKGRQRLSAYPNNSFLVDSRYDTDKSKETATAPGGGE